MAPERAALWAAWRRSCLLPRLTRIVGATPLRYDELRCDRIAIPLQTDVSRGRRRGFRRSDERPYLDHRCAHDGSDGEGDEATSYRYLVALEPPEPSAIGGSRWLGQRVW